MLHHAKKPCVMQALAGSSKEVPPVIGFSGRPWLPEVTGMMPIFAFEVSTAPAGHTNRQVQF